MRVTEPCVLCGATPQSCGPCEAAVAAWQKAAETDAKWRAVVEARARIAAGPHPDGWSNRAD